MNFDPTHSAPEGTSSGCKLTALVVNAESRCMCALLWMRAHCIYKKICVYIHIAGRVHIEPPISFIYVKEFKLEVEVDIRASVIFSPRLPHTSHGVFNCNWIRRIHVNCKQENIIAISS